MSTHKNMDRICVAAVTFSLLLCIITMNGEALGIQKADRLLGYENRLFDKSIVHTIDISIDDWDSFLASCQEEKYSMCTVTVDGEEYPAVGIRGKGNTSLSNVAQMDSDRYSFKLEFDHYDDSLSYYGLDKLCLNNIIQDNTYMKDYLAYSLMDDFGVDAPLCSFVYITVNGEDWGLYLAVEGVEDSFLTRNYGGSGELYKPDSMSFGGGKGNGKDFKMDEFMEKFEGEEGTENTMPQAPEGIGHPPEAGRQPPEMGGQVPEPGDPGGVGGRGGFNGGMGDMGSSGDAKLQYIDDDPDSYSTIFGSAKTDVSSADEKRLIRSLKQLSEYENLDEVLDIDKVIRYFVVHNFLVNGDSYTGSMIHNYYLHEKDGKLSMIPWDYNLAFGTFRGGDVSSAVNDPIDDILEDRPMQAWIFSDEEYTEMYHELFGEFLENADIGTIIDEAYALIAPYVEKDPTKFCTYEEFEKGVAALKEFCSLRSQSVSGQLEGSVPSTSEAQQSDSEKLIETEALTVSDMGTMGSGGGMGGGMGGGPGGFGGGEIPEMPEGMGEAPGSGNIPGMGTPPEMPDSMGDMPQMFSGMPGEAPVTDSGYQPTSEDYILLGICLALLLAGIAFAFFFGRRKKVKISG